MLMFTVSGTHTLVFLFFRLCCVVLCCVMLCCAESGSPTFNALVRAIGKSFGSVALGALIVSVCDMINMTLRLLDRVWVLCVLWLFVFA